MMKIIKELMLRYNKHHISAYSTQMAYFFMLSIFPLLIFILTIVSRFDMQSLLQTSGILANLPEDISELLSGFINQIDTGNGSAILSVAGLGTLLSASRGVTALQRAMNVVYEIDETRGFVRVKLTSMLYTFLFILLIIATLLIPNVGYKVVTWLQTHLFMYWSINMVTIFKIGRIIFLGFLYLLIFGTIYSKLPNERMKLKDNYYGAVFALFATMSENLIFSNVIVKLTDFALVYGSLSVMIVFMIWLYVFGNIIMLGAEINSMIWDKRNSQKKEVEAE